MSALCIHKIARQCLGTNRIVTKGELDDSLAFSPIDRPFEYTQVSGARITSRMKLRFRIHIYTDNGSLPDRADFVMENQR